MNKKAQFVELDFFMAILILVLAITFIMLPFINTYEDVQTDRLSYDAVNTLATLRFSDLNVSLQNKLVSDAQGYNISFNEEDTITTIVTKILVESQKSNPPEADILKIAQDLIRQILDEVIPNRYQYEVLIHSGQTHYYLKELAPDQKTQMASQSRSLLTGLEVQKPTGGFISSATLTEVKTKDTTYEFIGGFIGQGNVSFSIDLPSTITNQDIRQVYLEGLFRDEFSVYINNNFCIAIEDGFVSQILNCNQHINGGLNKIQIKFTGDKLENQYVSGGLIKIDYNYTQNIISATPSTITKRKHLPDIDGIINIYDSIYVPGKLTNVSLKLNHEMDILFKSTLDKSMPVDDEVRLIMNIGNETVYVSNESGAVSYQNKSVQLAHEYDDETIPFRLGFPDLTTSAAGGDVDIIIITDLSGSMSWKMNDSTSGTTRNCEDPNLFNVTTRRVSVAKCLITDFIEKTLTNQNNRIALINFDSNAKIDQGFTNNTNTLIQKVTAMRTGSGTCISCATAAALNISYIDQEREKIVILMTDGETNTKYINNYPTLTAPYNGVQISGTNYEQHSETFTDVIKQNNITIYTIAFALNSNRGKDFLNRTSSGDGYFFEGNDAEALKAAYEAIAVQITGLGYVAQTVNVTIDSFEKFDTKLTDSYIEYTYEPKKHSNLVGKIKITNEFELTNSCTQVFTFPYTNAQPGGGYITSYSDKFWTTQARINSEEIFNLSKYNLAFGKLGDPFALGFSQTSLNNNTNSMSLTLNDGEKDISVCNDNNKLIYDSYFPAIYSSKEILEKLDGCEWEYVYDAKTEYINIPHDYAGSKKCILSTNTYDVNDSMQVLGYNLLSTLMHEGELIIDIGNSDLQISSASIDDVPYMWGPALIGVTIWR